MFSDFSMVFNMCKQLKFVIFEFKIFKINTLYKIEKQ